jgi:UDPglucose 6-dehydrogenase
VLKNKLSDSVIFDGRNLYEPKTVEGLGLQYYAIGRGRT